MKVRSSDYYKILSGCPPQGTFARCPLPDPDALTRLQDNVKTQKAVETAQKMLQT